MIYIGLKDGKTDRQKDSKTQTERQEYGESERHKDKKAEGRKDSVTIKQLDIENFNFQLIMQKKYVRIVLNSNLNKNVI